MSAAAGRRPSSHHHRSPSSAATTTFASSSTTFSSRYSAVPSPSPSPATFLLHRSSSPTRVSLSPQPSQSSPSIRFSLGRPRPRSSSPSPSPSPSPRRTCMCSPTTHPGSFRCSLHKSSASSLAHSGQASSYSPSRLNARRSAMTNSLVRICGVEGGDLVKRALAALIRPSSHQQRRRTAFQPRPSRLSVMSKV
ncbi:hypothetical protein MLD38_014964 [Melastoma candidum]|uniref:Uncharacterized protein n=1 Tax=Melastoma candidum TaxID=119954 RepID=A0ACB9RI76_9MYRT|nr:hypothetical protein MLD38_014964 [Melastoma candidum]